MKTVSIIIPAALLLGGTAAYISVHYFFNAFYRSKKQCSPTMPQSLRAPGQSLGEKIDALNGKIGRHAAGLVTLLFSLCSTYLSHRYVFTSEINAAIIHIIILAGAGLSVYFLVKTIKLIYVRRLTQLEYENELAVGRELDRLIPEGNHVYHDFPAEDSNIDHIVVGRSGIFTVETGTRSKPAASNRIADATVEYNGKILMFPNGDDDETIVRAERQASYISEWISRTIGEQVAARAIVVLPGWFVKRTSPEGISVLNPKQFPSLFKHIKPRFLSDEMVTRIASQIEQKCRDVKPDLETHPLQT